MVIGMSPPKQELGDDQWVWGVEKDGKFSIKSAYKLLHELPELPSPANWSVVWRWKGPNRIRFFLWLAMQERLLTNQCRKRRHMTEDISCPLCPNEEETVGHVLRDCTFANEVWLQLRGGDTLADNWLADTQTWLQYDLQSDKGLDFGVTCWYLWRTRNERIFSNKHPPALSVAVQATSWAQMVKVALSRDKSLLDDADERRLEHISWDPGPEDWLTMNTDGSVNPQTRKATTGGLLRDWSVVVKHIYREGNHAVDHLAGLGYGYPFGSHMIQVTDSSLVYFFRYDCSGVSELRSILAND
ncbi:Putative ribonuclease H protein At1g65750 [Linum perenne]